MVDLILDTAGKGIALGLFGERIACVVHMPEARGEQVRAILDQTLRDYGVSLNVVRRVVVVNGPGSFTGLRTGIAFAQGLCFTGKRTLHALSSLASLWLQGCEESGRTVDAVLLYARPGFWYVGSDGYARGKMRRECFMDEEQIAECITGKFVVADRECPVTGPLSGLKHAWLQPRYPGLFEGARKVLSELEAARELGANYLQVSYAQRDG